MRSIKRWRPSRALAGSVALVLAVAGMALVLPSPVAGARGGEPTSTGGPGSPRASTAATCDAATMRGVWAFHLTGSGGGQRLAVAGHAVFDGQGGTSGILTEVLNGHVDRLPFEGTYSVDADCRGELSFRAEHSEFPDYHTVDFYLSAGGERAFLIVTSTDFVDLPGDDLSALPADSVTLSGVLERLWEAEITGQD